MISILRLIKTIKHFLVPGHSEYENNESIYPYRLFQIVFFLFSVPQVIPG
jgi:hypothetical protein